MEISKIDSNFVQNAGENFDEFDYYDVTQFPFALYGVFYDEEYGGFLRMPASVASSVNERIAYLNTNTAGGRLRFSTDSPVLRLIVRYRDFCRMAHMAIRGSGGFALTKNTREGEVFVKSVGPEFLDGEGYVRDFDLPVGHNAYTLHFPLYNPVDSLVIGVKKGSKVGEGIPYRDVLPILYYGSSITQGGCASRADNSYQGQISRKNNVDFVNLGFSGNAKAEPQIMEYLATVPCSVFVLDYDHNAPSVEYLAQTHFAAYEKFRAAQPDTPVVLVSRPDWYNGAGEEERMKVVKATYRKAKANGDHNVYFINGKTFFGKDWDTCTVDGCHPTDLGFYKMASKIGKVVNRILQEK